jgi:GTP-binding protein
VAGFDEARIGDTIAEAADVPPLPRISVDEPTLVMSFAANTGPFAGEDGKYVTSRHLRERLFKEARNNVALRVEETGTADVLRVIGRGELQLGILVESMRREGFELMLSRPEVVTREIDGALHEPLERLHIDCPTGMIGPVTELIGPRRARMIGMTHGDSRTVLVWEIPTRGLIGFHGELMTETRGTAILNTSFAGWTPWQGPIPGRRNGALIADRTGYTTPYALFHLQPRGVLFVEPGTRVYEGMVIGETPSGREIDVNACREKRLTNIRAAAKDENVILARPRLLTLEQAIEFIDEDELIEVTPQHIRIRKRVLSGGGRYKLAVPRSSG